MNKQRGFMGIVYIVAAIALLAAIGTLAYAANHWCNAACQDREAVIAERDATIAANKEENQRIRTAWARESTEAQFKLVISENRRNERFAPVEAASRNLPAHVAAAPLDGMVAGVVRDAIAAANDALTGPAAGTAQEAPAAAAADATVGDITTWAVAAAKQYAELAEQVIGWQNFYAALREQEDHAP